MKVLFITRPYLIDPLGLALLSASLKKAGHETFLELHEDGKDFALLNKVIKIQPDILAYSVYTGAHDYYVKLNKMIREQTKLKVVSVFGGPHCTYFEDIKDNEYVDVVMQGECDLTFPQLLEDLDTYKFPVVIKADMNPQDLDALPLPDRSLIYKFERNRNNPIKNIMTSRGCPFSCPYCFPEDTMIHTIKGMKSIQDISKGEKVLYAKGGDYGEVTQLYKREYKGDLIEINCGTMCVPTQSTPEHKILRYKFKKKSYLRADKINIKDKIVVPFVKEKLITDISVTKILGSKVGITKDGLAKYKRSKKKIYKNILLNKEFWILAGYYISEGSIDSGSVHFTFNKNEKEFCSQVSKYIKNIFGLKTSLTYQDNICRVSVYSFLVKDIFDNLFGHGSKNKYIPRLLYGQSKENVKEFINAWNNGDGDKNGQIVTVSPSLAMQSFILCWQNGITASLYRSDIKDSVINGREVHTENMRYTLHINRKNKDVVITKDSILLPIRSIIKKDYSGYVYNIGVRGKRTYTANTIGVHNCYNSVYNKMFCGKTVRYRSIDSVIEEGRKIKEDYPATEYIFFEDDEFIAIKDRVLEFSKKWKEVVGLPFHVQIRIDMLTEEKLKALVDAGCTSVTFAIETGNEDRRKNVLNRNISDKKILDGAALLRKYNIPFRTENMIATPQESLANALETLDINIKCKPMIGWASLFQPYPKTQLGELTVELGLFSGKLEDIPSTFFEETILKMDKKLKRQFENLQRLFGLVCSFPILRMFVPLLIRLPQNKLYDYIYTSWKNNQYNKLYKVG